MGVLLREALRRLCGEIGWSYAVFWSAIRCGNSRHLVWAEGHHERAIAPAVTGVSALDPAEALLKECGVFRATGGDRNPLAELTCPAEDRVGNLVNKIMRSQVHVVGDGVVGRAAITGNHQWILQSGVGYISQGSDEMNHQFSAGIKTIAVIAVLPHGVIQLGSTQMIVENMALIQHVKQYLLQLGYVPRALLSDGILKDLDLKNEVSIVGLSTSVYQSGNACSNLSNLLSFNSDNLVPQINTMINSLTQSSCMSGSPVFDRVPLNSNPSITTEGMSIRNCSDQAVIPSIPCHNVLLEGQAALPITDMQLLQTQIHGSSYGSQHQQSLVGPSLSCSSLSYLEGQLLSDIGQQRLLNSASASDSTNTIHLQSHGKKISSSLKDARMLVCRDELSNSPNHFGISGLLPCRMEKDAIGIQNLNSYAAAGQVVRNTNCSSGNSASGEAARRNTYKHTESMSTVTTSNIVSDLFQALENPCNYPKVSTMHSGPSTFCVQDCWVSSSNPIRSTQGGRGYVCVGSSDSASKNGQKDDGEHKSLHVGGECTPDECIPRVSGDDLFDVLGMDFKAKHCSGGLNAFGANGNGLSTRGSGTELSTCISQLKADTVFDAMNDGISSCRGIFSETGPDQLLDAVVSNFNYGAKHAFDDDLYCKTEITKTSNPMVHMSSSECGWASLQQQMHGEHSGLPPPVIKAEAASSSVKSAGSVGKTGECSQKDATYKSQISLWVENEQNMKIDSMLSAQCKRIDEVGKSNRKRPRPVESPRPRPKDRQMIQDRVKELREIVPNGAKCSIDALLERTIKHMLFLQSVTKHADKLKETGEPKIISKEGGLLLKDNFEGGATWAFEVGTRSMVCPIIVEDLKPPRQLLVEMLCEERGFFLEIADLIRGLGLTILKGVMEARKDKVWARFAVEANRDVTRMDIFMSLVRLLEPSAGSSAAAQGFENNNIPCNMVCQSSVPATGLANRLQ